MTDQLGMDFEGPTPFDKGGQKDFLTDEERAVLRLLRPGRKNALSVRFLASMAGVEERRLRQVVRNLVDHHGACIGSSTGSPPGYYIVEDPREIEDVYRRLRHRGISILQRAARLKKIAVEEVFKQGVIR